MTPFGPSPWDDPLTYATGWPATSCWLRSDRLEPLDDLEAAMAGRHAVLAVGSNGSPAQLHRKLGGTALPLVRVRVEGIESVHAAFATAYGAIPATASAGSSSELVLDLLDDAQLAVIDQSEGARYERITLDPSAHPVTEVASGTPIPGVSCYFSTSDVLADPATGRPMALRRQRELWEWLLASVPGVDALCGSTPEAATSALAASAQRRAALAVLLMRAGATTAPRRPA